jgi:hypothetical protein
MIFVSEFHNQWVMCLCSFHNTLLCMNVASCDFACVNFAYTGLNVTGLNVSQVVCVGVE